MFIFSSKFTEEADANFLFKHEGGAFRTSAELALRWSAHRLEQAVHARCSKILRPGTAILQKGRCIEQLPQRASCIAGCAGLGWLHAVNQLHSRLHGAAKNITRGQLTQFQRKKRVTMLPKPSQYEVAKKEPRPVPRNKVEASGCEAPTGVLVDPGKARYARSRDALSAFRFLPSSVSSDSMLTCRCDSARRKLYFSISKSHPLRLRLSSW